MEAHGSPFTFMYKSETIFCIVPPSASSSQNVSSPICLPPLANASSRLSFGYVVVIDFPKKECLWRH